MLPDNIILLLVLAAVFIFILIALAVLIFLGFRKSKDIRQPLTIIVASSSGLPMPNVDVKIGNDIETTNSYGKVQFHLRRGEYEVTITANGHAEFRKTIRAWDRKVLTVRLSRDKAHPELKQLEEIMESVRRGREEIGSGYNQTIPDYLSNVCIAVHDMVIEELKNQSDDTVKSECLKSAVTAIMQTSQGMVERRNLSLYAKAKNKKAKSIELPRMGPADIVEAKKKLSAVDSMITDRAGKKAISPPLVLWKTSQKLLSKPTIFNTKLATFLLDSAEKMINELGDYLL
ncbi:MAG: carboxypeptidase-like regulatory domain-containing protein [Candidatus Micrarchaeota archaeon]